MGTYIEAIPPIFMEVCLGCKLLASCKALT